MEVNMKLYRKLIVLLVSVLLLAVIAGTATADMNVFPWEKNSWMRYLPDDVPITQLNLPGTHDSATASINIAASPIASCQDWYIDEQLEEGIRVFDLRLRYEWDDYLEYMLMKEVGNPYVKPQILHLSHGGIDCYERVWLQPAFLLRMSDILKYCNNFLEKNPSETIVLFMKYEKMEPKGDIDSYKALVKEGIRNMATLVENDKELGKRVYYVKYGDYVPTLGEVRGKIVCIQDVDEKDPFTNVESHYDRPGLEGKEACIRKVLDPKAVGFQDYRDSYYNAPMFVFEDQYYDHKNLDKTPAKYGEPDVKIVQTNATDVSPSLKIITGHWPRAYAKHENPVAEELVNQVGKRYGWFLIDFPTKELIKKIGLSNNIMQKYNVDIIWEDGKDRPYDQVTIEWVNTKTGMTEKVLPLSITKSGNGSVWHVTFSPVLYNEKGEKQEYNIRVGADYFTAIYEAAETGWVTYTNRKELRTTQKVHMYPTSTKDIPFSIRWDDYHDMFKQRPEDIDALLQLYSANVKLNDGTLLRITNTNPDYKPYITFDYYSLDEWQCIIHDVPNTDENQKGLDPQLESFTPLHDWAPHTITKKIERTGIMFIFKYTYWPTTRISGDMNILDGNDKYGHWNGASSKIWLTVVGKTDTETMKTTEPVYFIRNDTAKEAKFETSTKLPIYDTKTGKKIEYTYEFPETLSDGKSFYQLIDGDYYLLCEVNVTAIWEDESNLYGARPDAVNMTLGSLHTGPSVFYSKLEDIQVTAKNKWVYSHSHPHNMIPLFDSEDRELVFEADSFPVSHYQVKSVEHRDSDDVYQRRNLRVTYEYDPTGAITINGNVRWYDGFAENVAHPTQRPVICFMRDNDPVRYGADNVKWNGDAYTCTFYPEDENVDPTEFKLVVDGSAVEGYSDPTVSGYDVVYIRQIDVHGEIDGTGFPEMNNGSYRIQLLRNNVLTGDEISVSQSSSGKCTFSFRDSLGSGIPATDDMGNPYEYDVRITADTGVSYIVKKEDPVVDTTTGDFTVNASAEAAEIKIPVTLGFTGIDPAEVQIPFVFTLTLEDYDIPQLELNQANGFTGEFDLSSLEWKEGFFTGYVDQKLSDSPNWTYDNHTGLVSVEVEMVDGVPKVTSIMINQSADCNFVNNWHEPYCITEIPVKTILDYSQKHEKAPVPASVLCVYELLLDPGTENEQIIDRKNAYNGADVSFTDLGFEAEGKYQFGVRQQPMNGKGWTADPETKIVTITVSKVGGYLQGTVDPSPVEFTSIYKPEDFVAVELPIVKEISGVDSTDAEFRFILQNPFDDGDYSTAVLKGAARGSFLPLVFYEPGTYTYIASEVSLPTDVDWYESEGSQEVKIYVYYNNSGKLEATYEPSEVKFVNEYAYTDVPVRVEWKDKDNEQGLRPDTLAVSLVRNSKEKNNDTVTAAEGWTHTLKHVPFYSYDADTDKKVINSYELLVNAPEGYICDVDGDADETGFVVTCYASTVEKINIPATVQWIDNDNSAKLRPDNVTVLLIDEDAMDDTYSFSEAEEWKHTFENQPKYRPWDEDKEPIGYTVYAFDVDGYLAPEITGDIEHGFVIIYRLAPEYHIILGAHQTIKTIDKEATFASDAPYEKFVSVTVDGETVPKQYYSSHSGSTVVIFNKKFIEKLSLGKHYLTIVSSDGSASTDFTLVFFPKTGDDTNIALLAILLTVSTTLMVFGLRRRKQ